MTKSFSVLLLLVAEEVVANVRTSLLDSKEQYQVNGSTDLSHDHLATRDSYYHYCGGSDTGKVEENDTVPDLMR